MKEEAKYCSKCHQMIKTISETCPKCGRMLYHIYHKKEVRIETMVRLSQKMGRWKETAKVPKAKVLAFKEKEMKEEILINKEEGLMRRMIGKMCSQCNQIFSANTEKCSKCDNCLLIPVWGEIEPLIQAS